uniref:bifunctional folylpolyglutamate synthase/dihydrofolate synthase n=1 Tax=Globicatella sulfidifaciens TaxID=136093 RepID=UPI0023F1D496|nr:Mur ligase family protein [Globicatella sulfidifaciens]
MIRTIEEAIQWMDDQQTEVHRVGLNKIQVALDFVGNPQRGLKTIHIGGTNGKGSVTAYLRNLFMKHGFTVGVFTSPHIMKFNERISLNGEAIDDETVIRLVKKMVELNEYMATTPYSRLVFFELYTVMMFLYFNEVQPDICLIEVGLGGLNDCTNVIDSKDILITTIGKDHVEQLGHTYREIAQQKAGIIHGDADVFIGELPAEAEAEIERICAIEGATLYRLGQDATYEIQSQSLTQGSIFQFNNHDIYCINMIGKHQIHNASLSLLFFQHWMRKYGHVIDTQLEHQALFETKWIGRMEKLSNQPLIYIDGAHNEAGLNALANTMQTYLADKKIKLIYSGLMTKNQLEHVNLLLKMPLAEIVFTEFEHPNSMLVDDFELLVKQQPEINIPTRFSIDWEHELTPGDQDILVVTGSLYFIAQVRAHYLKKELLLSDV